jgi:MFS transporter, DHA1 family, tetracycline resistance protein
MPEPTAFSPDLPPPDETAPAPAPVRGGSPLLIVFLVVFVDLLGFGIVLPLLPLFGKSYVAPLLGLPDTAEDARIGAVVGLLMASFSAMQFLCAPVWGRISDRIGRRPVLLTGLAGSVLFYALLGYALSLPTGDAGLALALLFVARIGAGVAGATIGTAQAVIADCTPPEKRKHGMALIGAAFGIGFTFGPLIGAAAFTFADNAHWLVGVIAAVLSGVALLLGLLLLPETRTPAVHQGRKLIDPHAIVVALRTPSIGPVILTFFLVTLGFGSFEATLSYLNADALRLPENRNFLMFAYVGFTLMLSQGLLYRRLARRLSEPTFMAIGIGLMALGVASLGVVTYLGVNNLTAFPVLLALMMLSVTVAVVGFSFLTPSAQALISRRSAATRQGEILGVNQSASALARILGPVFGLSLYKATGNHLLPYAFGAGLLLLMLPLMPRIRRGDTAPAAAEPPPDAAVPATAIQTSAPLPNGAAAAPAPRPGPTSAQP